MSTSLKRVASIPLVADSISTIHESLSSYSLTRSPYNLGLAIGEKALNLSQPIQERLAPVITRADGIANKGLDVVESRYPYAFITPSQDIYRDIKAYPDSAKEYAQKTANNMAHDIDQKLTPLVDRYESVLTRITSRSSTSRTPSEADSESSTESISKIAKSQVERAYHLTLDLRNQIYSLSSEQLAHHQILASVVQRVTETVYDVNTQIASSFLNVKGKGVLLKDATQSQVHQVGQSIHQQLDKVQIMTRSLPVHIQTSFAPVQDHLQKTLLALSEVLNSDAPMSDKATRLKETVKKEVQPLLDNTLDYVHAYSEASRNFIGLKIDQVKGMGSKPANGMPNVESKGFEANGSIVTAEDLRSNSR